MQEHKKEWFWPAGLNSALSRTPPVPVLPQKVFYLELQSAQNIEHPEPYPGTTSQLGARGGGLSLAPQSQPTVIGESAESLIYAGVILFYTCNFNQNFIK